MRAPRIFRFSYSKHVRDPSPEDLTDVDVIAFDMQHALGLFMKEHPGEEPSNVEDLGECLIHHDVYKAWQTEHPYR